VVSILDAIEKHPEKQKILVEMAKPVPDEKVHRTMVKAAYSYLLERFGKLVKNCTFSLLLCFW